MTTIYSLSGGIFDLVFNKNIAYVPKAAYLMTALRYDGKIVFMLDIKSVKLALRIQQSDTEMY